MWLLVLALIGALILYSMQRETLSMRTENKVVDGAGNVHITP
jgi:hypothetical protein